MLRGDTVAVAGTGGLRRLSRDAGTCACARNGTRARACDSTRARPWACADADTRIYGCACGACRAGAHCRTYAGADRDAYAYAEAYTAACARTHSDGDG